jgi:hypothetical protein
MSGVHIVSRSSRVPIETWLRTEVYIGIGYLKGTKKDAVFDFFFNGLSPWIQSIGYKWSRTENEIAIKFIKFCYEAEFTLTRPRRFTLMNPQPNHRNFPEDRETFDYFVSTDRFLEFLEQWQGSLPIVGSRLEVYLVEFCYVWVDVQSGPPGTWTQKNLEGDMDSDEEDAQNGNLPDMYSNRRKNDLY